jgi:tetratricopeptide (TPR) repeat protein
MIIMPGFADKMSHFWNELKDRRVIRSTTIYVAVAFGLLELIDIITGPLHLPGWVLMGFIFLFILGFPVTIMVSWIFCFTPEGIRRYKKLDWKAFSETQKDASLNALPDIGSARADESIPLEGEVNNYLEPSGTTRHTGRIYGFSSIVLICLVAVMFLFYGGKSVSFNERDWIVLADFVNHTGEEIFDRSLNTAFEISINQSRHINVITRKRVQEVLKRAGKENVTIIDEELCRDIAKREGADVYILPEISRVGNQYILTAELMETESSNVLVSEIYYTKSKGEILTKLDRLTRKMRRHLGESRYKISGQSKPLVQVTTSSLDALKQFSIAYEYHFNLDFEKAVTHYENAIRLDSNFTTAKASLGNILYEKFDKEKGKEWLDEAITSIDDLTDREQFSILAFYAANVEKDLDKSINYNRMVLELYPDSPVARNNLGWYFQQQKRYEESSIEYKEAIRIDPFFKLPYAGLIWNYLAYMGQLDSALFWSNRMISTEPENGWGYFYLGSCYFGLDEYGKAEREFEKARELAPELVLNLYRLANTYRTLEKYDRAVEVLEDIIRINITESPAFYNLGICYELMGEEEKAREKYLQYKSRTDYWEKQFPDNPNTFFSKGLVLTRLGQKEEGFKAGMKAFEMDTSNHFDFAGFLAVQDKKSEALDQLELALEQGYRDICWMKMEANVALLRDEPRFKQLLNQYFY